MNEQPGAAGPAWIGTAAAVVALVTLIALRYREAVFNFFFLDDFWVMHDAAAIHLDSPADLLEFFRVSHVGFLMYRPLTTVGYFWVLRQLFGYDSSAYHAFQVLVFTLSALLAFDIARMLARSNAAGLAVAVLFVIAPGQMVAVNWLAAFTVTGTAFVLLVLLWCWLRLDGTRRLVTCAAVQLVGLLSSEHAVVGPVLLVILAFVSPRREPWRGAARAIAAPAAIVAAYLTAKLWYFATGAPMVMPGYTITLDPTSWLTSFGHYAGFSFAPLELLAPGDTACLAVGTALAAIGAFAFRRILRGEQAWRLLATGLALFAAALLAVAGLRANRYPQYAALASFGFGLALVGAFPLLSRRWRALAIGFAAGALVFDLATEGRAWRGDLIYRFSSNGIASLAWLQAVQKAAAIEPPPATIFVPRNRLTANLFGKRRLFHTFAPGFPRDVRLYAEKRPPPAAPATVVVRHAVRKLEPGFPIVGCDPRWDWLRKLAAAGEDPAAMWGK
jgi:hypothetical protein